MMDINWSDPAVQSAVIQTSGAVLAAVLTAICATVIGKQFANRRKLQEKLLLAQQDIVFLLAVEEEHIKLHMQNNGTSYKNRIRGIARNRGLSWSGKFTPGRANDSPTLQACAAAVNN